MATDITNIYVKNDKDEFINSSIYTQRISVDLNANDYTLINIAPEWQIKVERQKRRINLFGSEKKISKKVYLSVCDINIPKEMMINVAEMLSVMIKGESNQLNEGSEIEYHLTSSSNSFSLFFNPNSIRDVSERQGKDDFRRKITFVIKIDDENKEQICQYDIELDILLTRLTAEPQAEISLKKRGKYNFKEIQGQQFGIGKLILSNPTPFNYSPEVDMHVEVKLEDSNGVEVEGLTIDNSTSSIVECKNVVSPFELKEGVEIPRPISYDLNMDFSGFRNPIEPRQYNYIKISGYWTYSYEPGVRHPFLSKSKELHINKDMQGTEMVVYVEGEKVNDGSTVNLPLFKFSPASEFGQNIDICLHNIATDKSCPQAGVYIEKISCSTQEPEMAALYDMNKRLLSPNDVNDLITVKGDSVDSIENGTPHFIANGDNAVSKISVRFDPYMIRSVGNCPSHKFTLTSIVEISHYANSDGVSLDKITPKPFKFGIVWQFEVLPYPEWLCVDYGSSAIVCIYNNKIINLNRTRKSLLSKCDIDTGEQDAESNTPFLSSDIIFNTVSENADNSWLCIEQPKQDYDKYAIFLAPTQELVRQNYQRQLPCLKLLVGNEQLPVNPDYDAYSYNCKSAQGIVVNKTLKETREEQMRNSLSKINVVFDETYKIMFEKYIDADITDRNRVNKLVLTYPNTYTPAHLKVLSDIARNTFSELRPDYLKFVSESDAVAAYYMSHWSEYNQGKDITAPERILVYDMGAGTLDITLVSKTFDKETGNYTLEILAKMGISKAGNYLDFVLASIFDERLAKTTRPSGAHADNVAKDRLELKAFVKNEVKPQIKLENKDQSVVWNKKSTKIGSILENPKFITYLKDCSEGIIKRMKHYVGGPLDVDTVILSGRSSRLEPLVEQLQKSVIKALKNKKNSDVSFIKLDTENEPDRQKTAVAYGAIQLAGVYNLPESRIKVKSRRLYASFGVAFKDAGGAYQYVELLNHTEIPYNDEFLRTLSSKEIEVTGLSVTNEVLLVQSYLSEVDTQDALRKNDSEYISIMSTYDLATFGGADSLKMKVELDKDNSITLCVNNSMARGKTPRGIELDSDTTKQSIWPVTI